MWCLNEIINKNIYVIKNYILCLHLFGTNLWYGHRRYGERPKSQPTRGKWINPEIFLSIPAGCAEWAESGQHIKSGRNVSSQVTSFVFKERWEYAGKWSFLTWILYRLSKRHLMESKKPILKAICLLSNRSSKKWFSEDLESLLIKPLWSICMMSMVRGIVIACNHFKKPVGRESTPVLTFIKICI
jgi:hypothetical protein